MNSDVLFKKRLLLQICRRSRANDRGKEYHSAGENLICGVERRGCSGL
jgi:hypothetical protein